MLMKSPVFCVGGCEDLDSLKSFLLIVTLAKLGPSVLVFSILNLPQGGVCGVGNSCGG